MMCIFDEMDEAKKHLEIIEALGAIKTPSFKGVEFGPLLREIGSNAFTMSHSKWVEPTGAICVISINGAGGGTFAQRYCL